MGVVARSSTIDEQIADLIAARVSASVREELQSLLVDAAPRTPTAGLTVDQVAVHLGVARSTVYAHWREWGGYKLGRGEKAPIRFAESTLPSRAVPQHERAPTTPRRTRRRRSRRDLITDAPRLVAPADDTV